MPSLEIRQPQPGRSKIMGWEKDSGKKLWEEQRPRFKSPAGYDRVNDHLGFKKANRRHSRFDREVEWGRS